MHPNIVIMLQRLFPEKFFIVSDALPSYGSKKKEYYWNNNLLKSDQGVCRLKDGTLAGTSLSLLEGCKRLAKWSGDASSSIWAGTVSPRYALRQGANIHQFLLRMPYKAMN